MSKIIRLIDRTRTVQDWKCPRSRFWGYEYQGRGLTKSGTTLELFTGIIVHDAMAAIATFQKNHDRVPIDEIANAAFTQLHNNLIDGSDGVLEQDALEFANEQGTLVEGMIRGFYQHVWPRLMDQYPKIVAVEQEMEYELEDGFIFMAKPDLIVEDSSGNLVYLEYKTTSSKKEGWINSWQTAVQLHSSIKAAEKSLGQAPSMVQIVGLYKGYECLSPDTPVLKTDLTWVPVGTLRIGDKLVGFEEESGNNRSGGKALREWREAEVNHVGRMELPCYEIKLEDGTEFVCSSNHLWLTSREYQGMGSAEWKTTEALKVNKSRIVKLFEPWEGTGEFDSYDAGYLAAAFDGEGSLGTMAFDQGGKEYYSLGLQFTQNPNEMLDHMIYLFDKYKIDYSVNKRKDRVVRDLQVYGKIKVLSLLGKTQPKRLLPKLNFNKLGMIKDLPRRPVKVVSKKFLGNREVVTLGTSTETLVAKGFATHNSYGKQSSPFCYAYMKRGNPPFSVDQISYEYKAGFKRYPTWEMDGGVAKWVAEMPSNVLADQFPMPALIMVDEDMVDSFFRQRLVREKEIAAGMEDIYRDDIDITQDTVDAVFPQKFDQCQPGFGKPCQFRKLCFGRVDDPLSEGYELRTPHHAKELERFEDHEE